MSKIVSSDLNFEREPMRSPWGFKGGYLTEIWQAVAALHGSTGLRGVGLGVQSVLWSDSDVFAATSESGGNAAMLLVTQRALQLATERSFTTPIDLFDSILPETYAYARSITHREDLRLTFALNALVAVDNAAWLLYAMEHGICSFDSLAPEAFRAGLGYRNRTVFSVPAIGYGMDVPVVVNLASEGYTILKIKIGSDPEKDGDLDKMLAWDIRRIEDIHLSLRDRVDVRYYLDANGRYDSLDRVMRFVEAIGKCGALDRTLLFEEPFAESNMTDVSAIPIRVVADESAHSEHDVLDRVDLGYGAIALKPVAKTLSMTLKMLAAARSRDVPCFCADLTVNPVLVDWNKSIAARLEPLPGLQSGLLENNGFQNYRNWTQMMSYHSRPGANWLLAQGGLFHLNDEFFTSGGGLFEPSPHYESLIR